MARESEHPRDHGSAILLASLDEEDPRIDLLSMPYALRQSIIVVEDEIAWEGRRAAILASRGDDEALKAAAKSVGDVDSSEAAAIGFAIAALLPGTPAGRAAAILAPIISKKIADAVKKARDRRIRVLPVALSELEPLRFPGGDPVRGVVYVGNPVFPPDYYPAATFIRRTFEHKFNELVQLVTSLGAVEIDVTAGQHDGRSLAANASAGTGQSPPISAKASKSRSFTSNLQSTFALKPGLPVVPQGLRWLEREDAWQTLVDLRLANRVTEYTVELTFAENFGIDTAVTAEISDLKLGLGGSSEDVDRTTWSIRARFEDGEPVATSAESDTPEEPEAA